MAIDFNDPNTINAFSMALGMIGQAFAQNPQQAAMASQAMKMAQGQQRAQLLSNMLKQSGAETTGTAGQVQAGYASRLTPEEIDQAPTTVAAGLQQPTGSMQTTQSGLSTMTPTMRMGLLSQLLGGGQTPFGSTQRR